MKGRLLIVDDERGIVVALKALFSKEGYEVETAHSGEEALEKVKAGLFHVVITDLSMKGMSGLELLHRVRELDTQCAVLMITAYGNQRIAIEVMKAGAEDYLPKPFDNDELRLKIRRVIATQLLRRAHNQLLDQVRMETGAFENMIGRSHRMLRVFETIEKVAPTDVTVLVRGESSFFAAALFQASKTTKNPYGEPSVLVGQMPYTFTRNPMYLGFVAALLGLAVFFGSLVMVAAPVIFVLTIDRLVIPAEEAAMERSFGEAYREYKASVRRWL